LSIDPTIVKGRKPYGFKSPGIKLQKISRKLQEVPEKTNSQEQGNELSLAASEPIKYPQIDIFF
jgi:hypothetical protein